MLHRLRDDVAEGADGEVEDGAAVHLEVAGGVAGGLIGADAALAVDGQRARAVGAEQVEAQAAGLIGVLQHHGARAVAEEAAGVAVGPIDGAAHDLGGDHQDGAGVDLHHAAGDDQAVDKARAGGAEVKGRGVLRAQHPLDLAGDRGIDRVVGRGGGDDDGAELLGGDASILKGAAGGLATEGRGILVRPHHVALADAGVRDDPLVARVHHLGHVVIRQNAFGHGRACSCDVRKHVPSSLT